MELSLIRFKMVYPYRIESATKKGPLVRGLKKLLTPIRWMGSTVAVYDCCVQEKADGRGETSRAHRGTKRRGKRSGSRNARKSRRLVTADPGFLETLSSKQRSYQRSYREARQVSWIGRRVREFVRIWQVAGRISDHGNLTRRRALRKKVHDGTANLVDVVSRISGSPMLMVKIRVYLCLELSGGPVYCIPFGNQKVRPSDAMETYKDFIESRNQPVRADLSPSDRKGTLTVDMLSWLVTSAPNTAPRVHNSRRENRAPVGKPPCVYCMQAPCARPGVNAKGVPLCKRLGVLTRPRNDGGNRR